MRLFRKPARVWPISITILFPNGIRKIKTLTVYDTSTWRDEEPLAWARSVYQRVLHEFEVDTADLNKRLVQMSVTTSFWVSPNTQLNCTGEEFVKAARTIK